MLPPGVCNWYTVALVSLQCDPELALTYLHMDVGLNHFVNLVLCKLSVLFPASLCRGSGF